MISRSTNSIAKIRLYLVDWLESTTVELRRLFRPIHTQNCRLKRYKLIFAWFMGKLEVNILHRPQPVIREHQSIPCNAFRIGRRKRTHAHPVLFAERYAFNGNIFDATVILVIDHVATMRAQVTFDVYTKLTLDI